MRSQLPIEVEKAVRSIDLGAKVILFGSRARGEAREDSDWDFLILTSQEVTPALEDKFRTKLYELELEYEQVISSVIENNQNWDNYLNSEFYKNVQTDGIEVEILKTA
ncbi:MAG: nucleotidyltransferase domain-containing protein [Bacteroidetes bacterium]|jgi:predicted nucleotidyltransferase|nr:nucleotidyltransferase domain-containing protein [Bacteroidota bacterium]